MFTPLSLVNVLLFAVLVVPMRVVGNVCVRGVSVIGMLPVPVSRTPMALPFEAEISICASATSHAVGSNTTLIVQVAPAAIVAPQVLVWVKSLAELPMNEIVPIV